ncbi:MAG: c-type cytochrome domain-containing protein, partial [Planctomycetota bacterium]
MRNSIAILFVLLGLKATYGEVDFATEIQPILAKRCYACHGPADQESGLGLHEFEAATRKLDSGERAIVPGKPLSSELIRRVTTADE